MRILVLDASPKKVSDTMRATSMFVKGIEDLNQGDVIEVVKLINCEIKPCLGCFQCWKNMDGKCIQEDDQNTLLEKYVKADIIIFSFPLYCYSMPSTLKAFLIEQSLLWRRVCQLKMRVLDMTLWWIFPRRGAWFSAVVDSHSLRITSSVWSVNSTWSFTVMSGSFIQKRRFWTSKRRRLSQSPFLRNSMRRERNLETAFGFQKRQSKI